MAAYDDTALIKACAAYTELEAEIGAYEAPLPAEAPPHPRVGEIEGLLDRLCNTRATTLEGIAARLQWLLRWEPKLIENWQDGYHDVRMVAALLRDLQNVLRVEPDPHALAATRARGRALARAWLAAAGRPTAEQWRAWGEEGLARMRAQLGSRGFA